MSVIWRDISVPQSICMRPPSMVVESCLVTASVDDDDHDAVIAACESGFVYIYKAFPHLYSSVVAGDIGGPLGSPYDSLQGAQPLSKWGNINSFTAPTGEDASSRAPISADSALGSSGDLLPWAIIGHRSLAAHPTLTSLGSIAFTTVAASPVGRIILIGTHEGLLHIVRVCPGHALHRESRLRGAGPVSPRVLHPWGVFRFQDPVVAAAVLPAPSPTLLVAHPDSLLAFRFPSSPTRSTARRAAHHAPADPRPGPRCLLDPALQLRHTAPPLRLASPCVGLIGPLVGPPAAPAGPIALALCASELLVLWARAPGPEAAVDTVLVSASVPLPCAAARVSLLQPAAHPHTDAPPALPAPLADAWTRAAAALAPSHAHLALLLVATGAAPPAPHLLVAHGPPAAPPVARLLPLDGRARPASLGAILSSPHPPLAQPAPAAAPPLAVAVLPHALAPGAPPITVALRHDSSAAVALALPDHALHALAPVLERLAAGTLAADALPPDATPPPPPSPPVVALRALLAAPASSSAAPPLVAHKPFAAAVGPVSLLALHARDATHAHGLSSSPLRPGPSLALLLAHAGGLTLTPLPHAAPAATSARDAAIARAIGSVSYTPPPHPLTELLRVPPAFQAVACVAEHLGRWRAEAAQELEETPAPLLSAHQLPEGHAGHEALPPLPAVDIGPGDDGPSPPLASPLAGLPAPSSGASAASSAGSVAARQPGPCRSPPSQAKGSGEMAAEVTAAVLAGVHAALRAPSACATATGVGIQDEDLLKEAIAVEAGRVRQIKSQQGIRDPELLQRHVDHLLKLKGALVAAQSSGDGGKDGKKPSRRKSAHKREELDASEKQSDSERKRRVDEYLWVVHESPDEDGDEPSIEHLSWFDLFELERRLGSK